MAYTAKADGAWVDKTATGGTATANLIDAGDCNRWEANQLDAHTRLTSLEASSGLPVVNVKSLGATGDGTTSDRTALQNAAAAVPSTGGILFLPAGTYSTDRCIDIKSNTTVMGAGPGVSIIRGRSGLGSVASTNGGYTLLGQASSATVNITIRDLTVDGTYSATGITSGSSLRAISSVVDFRGITGLTFENVEVKNGWFWHLTSWNSTNVTVRQCRVIGPGTSGTYDQLDGIHVTGVTKCHIENNFVDMGVGTDGDDGIAVHMFPSGTNCSFVTVTDNEVRGGFNGSGIDLANSNGTIAGVTIQGNLVHDCNNDGIVTNWFSSFTGSTQDVSIIGNITRDCNRSIVVGQTGQTPPYKNFVITNNLAVRAGGNPVQTSTTNAVNINITNNYTGS